MAERCAVIGVGQTVAKSKREDVSIAGLVREAAVAALEDAGLTFADIDAVVVGKAPDMFEGVMMPELYLAPALGAVGKPMFRVHTAGSVGGSTAIVASHLVASGIHERVLTVAFEKQSDSDAMWALSVPQPFSAPLLAGAGGYFAPIIRAYMYRSGAPRDIGMMVAVKDRLHALKNPYAHLHLPDISMQMVEESIMLWDPLHYLESCPSSDGAAAMVIGSEKAAGAATAATGRPPAWIHGMAMRSEPTMFAGRDQVNPQAGRDCAADLYKQAGITNPREDFDMAEVYVPFSWYEPMWLENLGFCRCNFNDRGRRHPVELLGWRFVVQSDRRLGHAPLPRDGPAGAWHGGRAPGARRPARPRPGLRWWLAVLRHVGRQRRQALGDEPCRYARRTKPALTRRSP
jgi:acetyl-CoA C-acetyltransferase